MENKTLNCTRCDGAGEVDHWRRDGSKVSCTCCDGRGIFESPDLVELCRVIKGRKPCTVRSKRPEEPRASDDGINCYRRRSIQTNA